MQFGTDVWVAQVAEYSLATDDSVDNEQVQVNEGREGQLEEIFDNLIKTRVWGHDSNGGDGKFFE